MENIWAHRLFDGVLGTNVKQNVKLITPAEGEDFVMCSELKLRGKSGIPCRSRANPTDVVTLTAVCAVNIPLFLTGAGVRYARGFSCSCV